MLGQPTHPSQHSASSDDPPRTPPAAARRRSTIRENINRELRGAIGLAVADMKRRPSERLDNIARGHVRPAGKLPEALEDMAAGGARRERVTRCLLDAVKRAIDGAFDAVDRAA